MAPTFPLSLNDFADKLKISTVKWELKRWDQLSGLGTGDVLAAQLAPPRIVGTVTIAPMYHADAAQVQALVESLDGPLNSFYLFAPQLPYPQSDPDGSILASSEVKIKSVGSNNKSLALKGLPASYALTVGDMMAFDYGSNPTRRAFHRIVESATADGSGDTAEFEVRPHLRPGAAADIVVTLKKPAAKVFIVPDTFDPGTAADLFTRGMQFEVMQRP